MAHNEKGADCRDSPRLLVIAAERGWAGLGDDLGSLGERCEREWNEQSGGGENVCKLGHVRLPNQC